MYTCWVIWKVVYLLYNTFFKKFPLSVRSCRVRCCFVSVFSSVLLIHHSLRICFVFLLPVIILCPLNYVIRYSVLFIYLPITPSSIHLLIHLLRCRSLYIIHLLSYSFLMLAVDTCNPACLTPPLPTCWYLASRPHPPALPGLYLFIMHLTYPSRPPTYPNTPPTHTLHPGWKGRES